MTVGAITGHIGADIAGAVAELPLSRPGNALWASSNERKLTMSDDTVITEADLTIEHGRPDERFAGTPLDSWRGYQPLPSVVTAIEKAIERPGVAMIAYAHELPDDPFRLTDDHQRRAARAWVAEHHPHLKIKVGTEVVPFRGVGSDCRVFKVSVGAERPRIDG